MQTVMWGETLRRFVELDRDAPSLAESPEHCAGGNRLLVDLGDLLGVVQFGQQIEWTLRPLERVVEVALVPRGNRAGVERCRTQLGIAEPVGELGRGTSILRARFVCPQHPRHERLDHRRAVRLDEVDGAVDPAEHEISIRRRLPHPGTERGLVPELRVRLAARDWIGADGERALHRLPELDAAEAECVRASDLAPQL